MGHLSKLMKSYTEGLFILSLSFTIYNYTYIYIYIQLSCLVKIRTKSEVKYKILGSSTCDSVLYEVHHSKIRIWPYYNTLPYLQLNTHTHSHTHTHTQFSKCFQIQARNLVTAYWEMNIGINSYSFLRKRNKIKPHSILGSWYFDLLT